MPRALSSLTAQAGITVPVPTTPESAVPQAYVDERFDPLLESHDEEASSGFVSWAGPGPYWEINGTDFTLLVGGTGYVRGAKVDWTAPQTISLAGDKGHWIHVDANGVLGCTAENMNDTVFYDTVVLFEALVSGTDTLVVRENHPYRFQTSISTYLHNNVGTIIGAAAGSAVVGAIITPTTAGTGVYLLGSAVYDDHGIRVAIPAGDAGTPQTVQFWYSLEPSHVWRRHSVGGEFPLVYSTGSGVAALAAGQYGVVTLYVTKDDVNTAAPQVIGVIDAHAYATLAEAQTAVAGNTISLAYGELAKMELAQLGHVIIKNNAGTVAVAEAVPERQVFTSKALAAGSPVASNDHVFLQNQDGGTFRDGGHAALATRTTATTDPTTAHDGSEGQGFKTLSWWLNTGTQDVFVNLANTEGAAVWRALALQGTTPSFAGVTLPSFTPGAVPFIGADAALSQNANYHYDATLGLLINGDSAISADGAQLIRLTWRGTGATVKGTVVTAHATFDNVCTTAGANEKAPVGVIWQAGVVAGAPVWVAVGGKCQVLLENNTATGRGNWVYTGATGGRANGARATPKANTIYQSLGRSLQTLTAGTNQLCWIQLRMV